MSIVIHKLTPERLDEYLRFFDTTPHSTNKAEHRCYCVCWCSDNANGKDFSTAEKRREWAKAYVEGRQIQGYLAYSDGQVIGWCNANTKADCYGCLSWQMFMQSVRRDEPAPDTKVQSVFCFTVAPEMRGQGVAELLLQRVCEDAAKDGFAYVEAYPNKVFVDTEQDFMGPVLLFEKLGFTACYEAGEKLVMRKALKAR